MSNKIALLVDSGMDLPTEIIAKEGVYVIPLNIIYKDHVYIDKVTITSKEIYDRLETEVPSTSLPDGQAIHDILEQIIADGYTQLIVGTISSGLSGTNNMLNLMVKDFPQLESFVLDTKSIGIGGGVQGYYAKRLIDEGLTFAEITKKLTAHVSDSRVFFSIPTLEYLKKGGRIGLVSSILGTALNLNPVISCNTDGIYHTVSKARGRKRSIEKMLSAVEEFIGNHPAYDIGVAYGNCIDEARELAEVVKQRFPNCQKLFFDEVSPALGIHTGPGVIGMGVQLRD
ncbi:DegV family protein [Vagococcus salmoninarum]|uniref:DegV family protein n=1 Tax=Vagococcus salmoninarum TaxID=2739 RepID=UPI001880D1B2|nr:DegV family protein [Vagococcus salmoninarum]MBE9389959.1 DegV family protein [Vagococcus salmoninarum]